MKIILKNEAFFTLFRVELWLPIRWSVLETVEWRIRWTGSSRRSHRRTGAGKRLLSALKRFHRRKAALLFRSIHWSIWNILDVCTNVSYTVKMIKKQKSLFSQWKKRENWPDFSLLFLISFFQIEDCQISHFPGISNRFYGVKKYPRRLPFQGRVSLETILCWTPGYR